MHVCVCRAILCLQLCLYLVILLCLSMYVYRAHLHMQVYIYRALVRVLNLCRENRARTRASEKGYDRMLKELRESTCTRTCERKRAWERERACERARLQRGLLGIYKHDYVCVCVCVSECVRLFLRVLLYLRFWVCVRVRDSQQLQLRTHRVAFETSMSMSHVMHESCHNYEWVMPHIRMSHVPFLKTPCLALETSKAAILCVCVCVRACAHARE